MPAFTILEIVVLGAALGPRFLLRLLLAITVGLIPFLNALVALVLGIVYKRYWDAALSTLCFIAFFIVIGMNPKGKELKAGMEQTFSARVVDEADCISWSKRPDLHPIFPDRVQAEWRDSLRSAVLRAAALPYYTDNYDIGPDHKPASLQLLEQHQRDFDTLAERTFPIYKRAVERKGAKNQLALSALTANEQALFTTEVERFTMRYLRHTTSTTDAGWRCLAFFLYLVNVWYCAIRLILFGGTRESLAEQLQNAHLQKKLRQQRKSEPVA